MVVVLLLLVVLQLLGFLLLPSLPFSWLILFVVASFFAATSAMHKSKLKT